MTNKIKHLITFLLILWANIVIGQTKTDSLNSLINDLGQKLLEEKKAVGFSVGIYENGKSRFFNYGTTQVDQSIKPSQNTIYEIGSITKTFESYILANAVIEGRVKLDDDIRKYLKGSYPNLEFNGQFIKLVHLANTTSLLPDWLPELPAEMKGMSSDSALAIKIKYYENLSKKDFFAALHKVKLDTIPGAKRYHSNAGAQLLAYILEDVYKMPMDKLIKRYITGPQKMENTSFITSSKMKGVAIGYAANGNKAIYEYSLPYFKYAGGLGSSTSDMVKYIQLMLNNKNPASVLCLKKTADINASTGRIVPMQSDGVADPNIYSSALNWFKYQPEANYSQIWADGGTNGFNSYLVIYPHLYSGIILVANKSDEKIFRALPGIASQISEMLDKK